MAAIARVWRTRNAPPNALVGFPRAAPHGVPAAVATRISASGGQRSRDGNFRGARSRDESYITPRGKWSWLTERIAKGILVAGGSSVRRTAFQRRPFVPPSAAGLLAAVATARAGDDSALVRWEIDARPKLWRALRRAGFDPAGADDAITFLLEQADRAARSGQFAQREAAWMSAVLASARREQRRTRIRAEEAHRRLATFARQEFEPVRRTELHEELLAASTRLRHRFALAIRLRLSGLDAHEIHVALCVEFDIGLEQARKIDRRSIGLMRAALAARDAGAESTRKNLGIQYQLAPGPASSS